LFLQNKQLAADIKSNKAQLIKRTKKVIEQELSDRDIRYLLSAQWIDSLYHKLGELPQRVISDLVQELKDLVAKYDTTLMDVEREIQEASASLATMIDELTGSAHDLEALAEFKKLLLNA
jgi:type I restriction system adenine methylase (hsdM)